MTSQGRTGKDYYQILGVLRNAKLADITAAYHVLARKCHPDVGATDPESLAEFKLVNEAYQILSDEGKRKVYDGQRRAHQKVAPLVVRSSLSSAIRRSGTHASASAPTSPEAPTGPLDIEADLPIAPEEAVHGGPCDLTVSIWQTCRQCLGQGHVACDTCESCHGEGGVYERHRLQLMLPRRLQPDAVIRVLGHGERSENLTGDLMLRVRIQPCW